MPDSLVVVLGEQLDRSRAVKDPVFGVQPLADAAGGERVRQQKDEVAKLGESVIAVRADVAGAPAADRAVGDLRNRGNVELCDAEGFQCVHDLAGLDGPIQCSGHPKTSSTSGFTTAYATGACDG